MKRQLAVVMSTPALLRAICKFQNGVFRKCSPEICHNAATPLHTALITQTSYSKMAERPRERQTRWGKPLKAHDMTASPGTPWTPERPRKRQTRWEGPLKAMTSSPDAFVDVLTSPELQFIICAFQFGLYEEMLPLRPWDLSLVNPMKPCKSYLRIQKRLTQCLSGNKRSRVFLLLDLVPRMRSLIAVYACSTGRLDILQLVIENYRPLPRSVDIMEYAARYGQLSIVDYLVSTGYPADTRAATRTAAFHGHLEVVKYLVGQFGSDKAHLFEHDMAELVRCGHCDVAAFLVPHFDPSVAQQLMAVAASYGHTDLAHSLAESVGPATLHVDAKYANIAEAASLGNIEALAWLFDIYDFIPDPWRLTAAKQAALRGVFHLHSPKCSLSERWKVLEWLVHEQDLTMDDVIQVLGESNSKSAVEINRGAPVLTALASLLGDY
ncbi:hypothetical protein Ae201684P_014148 [Aphanomyces euteiches]|uniref:Uncharacterized protein n=2 Tax=Aphanomyces euteiches TaxID=100861 RepID=A0A6G0WRM7_9STRA|nr:hypothetical protein Ae201684_012391 [Aphanomyces euteiches]KAH9090342.1 hypothetical protein Ae201684P_014148 [Aphanomyces euteiches]KAH9135563.1 hypothetical protein AeRB84_019051 [Aphanomyces euteiches]